MCDAEAPVSETPTLYLWKTWVVSYPIFTTGYSALAIFHPLSPSGICGCKTSMRRGLLKGHLLIRSVLFDETMRNFVGRKNSFTYHILAECRVEFSLNSPGSHRHHQVGVFDIPNPVS